MLHYPATNVAHIETQTNHSLITVVRVERKRLVKINVCMSSNLH